MPVYDAACFRCGAEVEYVSSISARHETPLCPRCHGSTERIITRAPMGFVKNNFEAFKSPVDGSVIRSGRDLREHNARNGVVNIHDGYDEAKVLSGDFGKKEVKPDPKDIARDVGEAIHKLEHEGYTPPPREAYDE